MVKKTWSECSIPVKIDPIKLNTGINSINRRYPILSFFDSGKFCRNTSFINNHTIKTEPIDEIKLNMKGTKYPKPKREKGASKKGQSMLEEGEEYSSMFIP